MCVFYENMQQCFMIKALFGCKEQKLTQTDLKRNNRCKDTVGNARNIDRYGSATGSQRN